MTTHKYNQWILSKKTSKAQKTEYYGGNLQINPEDHGTSHVSVIDEYGNGVSSTSTINRWFGATIQSRKLGIVWNDEMDDFSTPGQSNGFGFAPSKTNFIQPKKRPMSSMSPMIVYHQNSGKLKFVIGASGGSKIISAVSKPIVRVLCFNETIKQAIDAPSLHNQFTPDQTQYEDNV
uniref:Gamma-glutamyltranspeptidase n=1 Tax=Panagrolaimus sp. JU765 TaxID=591449 RepID=A0AC34R2F3_9BILA